MTTKPKVECADCGRALTATTVDPYCYRDMRWWYVRGHKRPDGTACPCDHSEPMQLLHSTRPGDLGRNR